MNASRFSPRSLGSWGIVGILLAAVVAWMATGMFAGDRHAQAVEQPTAAPDARFTVSGREQSAESVERRVQLNGDTLPDQIVNIASQVEGQVIAVGPRKGARLRQGDLLARIDPRDAEAQRTRSRAQLRTRELEYAGARKLRETGYVTEAEVASRLGNLELARADLKDAEIRLANLTIVAPVDGILEERSVEIGDYTKVGQPVATLIKIDPLLVQGVVNEAEVGTVTPGSPATAEVLGKTLPGRVRFVSSMADPKTRTFTVEVAVDNPDSQIPAGLSARVVLPVGSIAAQRIPASLLSLSDSGALGVKHVVGGKVAFSPATIVRADDDAVYVVGLPERITLITRGQGFVTAGQPVTVELERADSASK